MRLAAGLGLLLLASPGWPAASFPEAVQQGGTLFFHGDLAGAVERWRTVREEGGGSREFDALLASALTALGKRDLAAKRYSSARKRFAEALAIERGNRGLRRLSLTAELGEQLGELKTLRPEDTDATEELDRLMTALLLADREPAAAEAAAPEAPAAPAAAQASPAASPAEKRKAAADYESGLERYYAGDYQKARNLFLEALRLDPKLKAARRGAALARAALLRADAEQRYQEALRAFYSGDLAAARTKLREVLVLDPSHAKARETLARMEAPPGPER